MILKYIPAEVKEVEGEQDIFEVVASTSQVDRMGDTIDQNGWYLKNYHANPVILWSHSSGGGFGSIALPPVAKANKTWVDGEGKLAKLKQKIEFAPTAFAQELKTLVKGKFLNAVSVGFMPLVLDEKGQIEIEGKMYRRAFEEEMQKGIYGKEGDHFTKQELLEVSWVDVPALPQALVTAQRMNAPLMVKTIKDMQMETGAELEMKFEEKEMGNEFEKPYPNEHSCRIADPKDFDNFARKNCYKESDGKCIDYIFGIKEGKSKLQAMRYKKDTWTEEAARKHCGDAGGSFEAAAESKEETPAMDKNMLAKLKTQLGEAISAIEEILLNAELPNKSTTPENEVKGRINEKPAKSDTSKGNANLRLLRIADKAIEAAIKNTKAKK